MLPSRSVKALQQWNQLNEYAELFYKLLTKVTGVILVYN